jgi:D-alanyl-lipoteichoic acid acyltransferase DltB (MBOAT superfamily)
MLFNSLQFAVFFPVVTVTYFLLPHRHRWWLLLGASIYFYMVFVPAYIVILGTTIVIDYFAGIWIEKAGNPKQRKNYLLLSLAANILILAFFKYFNFLNGNLLVLAGFIGWNYPIQNLNIILPVGLSFHTFQAMSYTIEVYRGHQKAEHHFGMYALYVMFYPQLVAGPIERPQNILHQLHEEHTFEYQRTADGLKLMAWGLFKKVVIADRLAPMVGLYYNNPVSASGLQLAFATACFAIQIFCDFSGYSDMAIGAAKIMGINLMENFRRPYAARSVAEFWSRWHISLSTWFRDYVYIPLGGNRVSQTRWAMNIMIVFLLSGLWHGASWTFVIWGALHGAFMVGEALVKKIKFSNVNFPLWLSTPIQKGVTLWLVGMAWVFFRASTFEDARLITSKIITGFPSTQEVVNFTLAQARDFSFIITLLMMVAMSFVHYLQEKGVFLERLHRTPYAMRVFMYAGLVASILIFGRLYTEPVDFIYFQF